MKTGLVRKILGQCYIWLVLFLMYLPILVITAYSFSSSTAIIGKGFKFDFDLYPKLFANKALMVAVGNTLLIALISAVVATLLGTLGAIGAFYSKRRMKNTMDMANQINIVNAEIVIAFSLTVMFVFLGQYIFKADLFSFWTILIGHVCLSAPFVYISVKPKLQQMDPSLYEAAIDLGASPSVALRKAVIPEILPGIVSGFMLAITLSLDDFIITEFLTGAGLLNGNNKITTISTFVQHAMHKKSVPLETRSLTAIIFLIVVIGVIIVSIYKKKQSGKVKVRKGRNV